MTREELELLAHVKIASPCPMKWSDMHGDERRRVCAQCNQHVFKVAELTTSEAVALFRNARTQRVCAQLFHRIDGTVMTKDCPSAWSVGVSAAIARVGLPVGVVAASLFLFLACAVAVITVFGDHLRAALGESTGGALAGSTPVVSASRPHEGGLFDRFDDD
jgi:hypothetical protein